MSKPTYTVGEYLIALGGKDRTMQFLVRVTEVRRDGTAKSVIITPPHPGYDTLGGTWYLSPDWPTRPPEGEEEMRWVMEARLNGD